MQEQSSKDMLQQIYADMANGNAQPFMDALAESVRWTVIGSTAFSGPLDGKPQVEAKLMGPLMARLEGGIALTPFNFTADGDFVAMQSTGKARTKTGRDYNNTYCHVFRFEGRMIAEVTEYCDTELITHAFGE